MVSKSGQKNTKRPPRKQRRSKAAMRGMLTTFRSNDPFAPKTFKSVTYAGTYSLSTPGTSSFNVGGIFEWKLNDPYDPFNAVIPANLDTSAYGLADLATLYNRYKCYACDIKVNFFNPNNTGIVCCAQVLNPSNTGITIAGDNYDVLKSRPMSWVQPISNTGSRSVVFRQYSKMYPLFGFTKSQYNTDTDNTTAGTGGSPASYPILQLGVADSNAGASAKTVQFTIEIRYYCEFYQRKELQN